jgi:hypothetical protein
VYLKGRSVSMLGVLARSLAAVGPDLPNVQLKIMPLERADQVSLSGRSVPSPTAGIFSQASAIV